MLPHPCQNFHPTRRRLPPVSSEDKTLTTDELGVMSSGGADVDGTGFSEDRAEHCEKCQSRAQSTRHRLTGKEVVK